VGKLTHNVLNQREDYLSSIRSKWRWKKLIATLIMVGKNFTTQTPRLCMADKPFVHMTFS